MAGNRSHFSIVVLPRCMSTSAINLDRKEQKQVVDLKCRSQATELYLAENDLKMSNMTKYKYLFRPWCCCYFSKFDQWTDLS